MELIILIIIIAIVVNSAKKKAAGEVKTTGSDVTYDANSGTYTGGTTYTSTASRTSGTTYTSTASRTSGNLEPWQKAAMENIAKAKARAEQMVQMTLSELEIDNSDTGENDPWFEADPRKARMEELKRKAEARAADRARQENTTILERAVSHTDAMKEDVTLDTMEAEHHHSEREATTVHTHPEDIIQENMLGSLDDLMIKGYDGYLCFERDFLGEGMDMIARFTPPTDVPDLM